MELQAGQRPSRLHHPHQLAEGGGRVGHVAEQVGEGEGVEGGIGEGQVLGPSEDQVDATTARMAGQVGPGRLQHLGCDIDTGHPRRRAGGQLQGDPARAGGDVEHPGGARPSGNTGTTANAGHAGQGGQGGHAGSAGQGGHHGPAPAAVLAERQHLGQAVVPGRKAIEQLAGEAVKGPFPARRAPCGPGGLGAVEGRAYGPGADNRADRAPNRAGQGSGKQGRALRLA